MIDDTCDWIIQGLRSPDGQPGPDHLAIPDEIKESLKAMQAANKDLQVLNIKDLQTSPCEFYCSDRNCNITPVSFAEQDRAFN